MGSDDAARRVGSEAARLRLWVGGSGATCARGRCSRGQSSPRPGALGRVRPAQRARSARVSASAHPCCELRVRSCAHGAFGHLRAGAGARRVHRKRSVGACARHDEPSHTHVRSRVYYAYAIVPRDRASSRASTRSATARHERRLQSQPKRNRMLENVFPISLLQGLQSFCVVLFWLDFGCFRHADRAHQLLEATWTPPPFS